MEQNILLSTDCQNTFIAIKNVQNSIRGFLTRIKAEKDRDLIANSETIATLYEISNNCDDFAALFDCECTHLRPSKASVSDINGEAYKTLRILHNIAIPSNAHPMTRYYLNEAIRQANILSACIPSLYKIC